MSVHHRASAERGLHQDHELEIWGSLDAVDTATDRSHEGRIREEIWGPTSGTAIAISSEISVPEAIWGVGTTTETSRPAPRPDHNGHFVLPDAWAAAPRRLTWHRLLRVLGRFNRRTG